MAMMMTLSQFCQKSDSVADRASSERKGMASLPLQA
jgi:hypothetical protein